MVRFGTPARRVQMAHHRGLAHVVLDVADPGTHAHGIGQVGVGQARDAHLRSAVDIGPDHRGEVRIQAERALDVNRSGVAVVRVVGEVLVRLDPFQNPVDRFPGPVGIARRHPPLHVVAERPHPSHGVDRRAPAHDLSGHGVEPAAVDGPLDGQRVDVGTLEPEPVPAAGQPDGVGRRPGIRRGLQQQHLAARILAQPRRGHTAPGAAADDDDVVVIGHGFLLPGLQRHTRTGTGSGTITVYLYRRRVSYAALPRNSASRSAIT